MACNCIGTEQECIRLGINPCDTAIPLGIIVSLSGEYVVTIFGGLAGKRFAFSLESGDEIVLPNEINNNFVYQMQITDPNGDLFNDTCYTLRTFVQLGSANNIPPSPSPENYKFITVEEYNISNDGDTLTDAWFANHTVIEIITSNQAYIRDTDFTQAADTITWLNGNKFYDGQTILAQA